MERRPQYTQEFKDQAVRLTLMENMTLHQVARDLGISSGALVSWRQKAGVAEGRSRGQGGVALLKRENEELRRKNLLLEKEKKAVEMERDVIKKAAAFFAKNLA